jgi:uncharacterized linocin/CFP29 family protein
METATSAQSSTPTTPSDEGGDDGQDQSLHHKENEKVPWKPEIWKAIHRTVHEESLRVRVGARFLPHRRVHPKTTSVPPDTITTNQVLPGESGYTLTVDEGASIRLNEIWTEFALTTQQVHETAEAKNPMHTTAVTLARRAAQYLALAQDIVIFQGFSGYTSSQFFLNNVRSRTPWPLDSGLLSLAVNSAGQNPYLSPNTPIQVQPLPPGSPPGVTYGENTFSAVTQGYAILTSQGHPGPYALVLNTFPYADLYAAVGLGSLVITADRVEPLVKAGLFGTGTVPPNLNPGGSPASSLRSSPPDSPAEPAYYGVLVSLGGDTMDLVVGMHATTVFMQQDTNQLWRFRVMERFALRVLDTSAIQVMEFV